MSNEIVVFHFQGGTSDKHWAVRKKENADGTHDIWYGRRGNRLRFVTSAGKSLAKRMNEKLKEGYERVEGATIDVETRKVIFLDDSTNDVPSIPSSLWYRFRDPHFDRNEIQEYLDTTVLNLADEFKHEAEILVELPIFKALRQGDKNGGAELSEGPLGIFLIFALRRYMRDEGFIPGTNDFIQLADDNNDILLNDFDFLGDLIVESSVAFLEVNQCINDDKSVNHDKVREKHLNRFLSLSATKELAIAMGCIEAPIDLTVIPTDTTAAYF
ncbi:MAG: hypothetical protein COA54_03505 [Thiotrichaceae bacterium]|nr:MAG: hypothetical protein COA54_03505 [Thiotrichaceae bacterium]